MEVFTLCCAKVITEIQRRYIKDVTLILPTAIWLFIFEPYLDECCAQLLAS